MYGPPGSYHVTGQQQLSLICGEVGRPHEAPKLGTFHRLLLTSAPVSAQSRLWLVLQTQPHILDVCEGREGPLLRPRPVPHPTQLCFVCTRSFVLVRDPRQPVKVLVREKRGPPQSYVCQTSLGNSPKEAGIRKRDLAPLPWGGRKASIPAEGMGVYAGFRVLFVV